MIDRREFFTGLTLPGRPRTRDRSSQARVLAGLDEAEARALTGRILAMSQAEGMQVRLGASWRGDTRYAVNRVTTAGDVEDLLATITARFGKREASITTNRFDEASLTEAVRNAEGLARLAPEDPEAMPLLGLQDYLKVDGYAPATANLDAAERARVAEAAIGRVLEAGDLQAAGFLECTAGAQAIANSAGLFAYHPGTSVDYSLTVRTADGAGSGWAGVGHRDWSAVDSEELHRRAVEKARRSRNPRSLEPGKYRVVLEPAAVSDLVRLLGFSLNARSADEGRSAFASPGGGTKLGQKIVHERVTLRSDPVALGAAPFAGDGQTLEPITWIENGVLKNLFYNRFWAEKQGKKPTGFPNTLVMRGGEGSVEDLIRDTERGVLVTRLWYIRQVDPRTILYTGLTRDGTFLIENGAIAGPVNNFRWNDSPLSVLSKLEAMSRPVRVETNREVPAIRVTEFNFTSVSEAV